MVHSFVASVTATDFQTAFRSFFLTTKDLHREFSNDPVQFAKNLLFPVKPKNTYVSQKSDGKRILNTQLDLRDHKSMTGSAGKKKMEAVRSHLLRHYPTLDGIELKQ